MSRSPSEPAVADTSSQSARPRLLVPALLVGAPVLGLLIWSAMFSGPPPLLTIAVAIFAAELLLGIHIDEGRSISLSSPFLFIAFLTQGAAVAAGLQVTAWLCARLAWQWRRRAQLRPTPILSSAAQQLTCHFAGGIAVWLVTQTPLFQPPTELLRALVLYVAAYLLCSVLLSLVLSVAGAGQREAVPPVGVDTELLSIVSFVVGAPLALFTLGLQSQLGFAVDVLLAFAGVASVSYMARLRLQLTETTLEYSVLNDISRNLSGSLELGKLYPVIYSRVRQVMPVDVFLIGLINDKQTELEIPFVVEGGELLAPRRLAIAGTVAEQVMRDGTSLYMDRATQTLPLLRFGQSDLTPAAVLFVPLCLGDTPIGMMSAQSYTEDAYTPQQLSLLEAIGRIAAVALNNARLFAREKEMLRSREEFISLVAHELKNPLAALLGHTQILERRVRKADEKLRRPVSIIGEQGERMNRMVEDLLDLSRADSGRLTLHMQRVDLTSLTRDVVEQHRILTSRHELLSEVVGTIPVVQGDVLRLSQVLQNLLSNAIKYSPAGGTIRVRLETWPGDAPQWPPQLRKQTSGAACWAVTRVIDQGIGIAEDQLERIFDRFYRVNSATQLDVAGAGLGLSVCEGLIRAQGGVIWAESEWSVGSTFSFALPVPASGER